MKFPILKIFLFVLSMAWGSPLSIWGQSKFLESFGIGTASSQGRPLPPSNSISHISIDSITVWIGTGKGVGKTSDYGQSWQSYRNDPAFANEGIFAIAANHDTIWAATGFEKEISGGTVQTGSGYSYSFDGGATWHHADQTLDQRGDSIISYGINDSLRILPVVVPEQNVTFDVALSPQAVWIASWASGLRKSTNYGNTWERIPLPPDNRSSLAPSDTLWTYAQTDTAKLHRLFPLFDPRRNNNFLAFSIYTPDGITVWCGTAGGVNRSTDGGLHWTKYNHQNQALPILGNWVIAIDEQRFQGKSRIWTTNWKAEDPDEEYGVSYTDDGGSTWQNLLQGVKAYDFAFKDSIAYIASDQGIFRTSDGGLSFNNVTSITDPASHQLIAYSSVFSVAVIADTVLVGTADGLAATIDNANHPFGSTWIVRRTYQEVQATSETYAYPNPFSPRFQVIRVHYGKSPTPTIDRSVTIDIFDFGMNRVRTLLNQALRSGSSEYDEIWDGRRDDGTMVANGIYIYRVTIDSGDSQFGKILVLQ